jgi:hypothetical protein
MEDVSQYLPHRCWATVSLTPTSQWVGNILVLVATPGSISRLRDSSACLAPFCAHSAMGTISGCARCARIMQWCLIRCAFPCPIIHQHSCRFTILLLTMSTILQVALWFVHNCYILEPQSAWNWITYQPISWWSATASSLTSRPSNTQLVLAQQLTVLSPAIVPQH